MQFIIGSYLFYYSLIESEPPDRQHHLADKNITIANNVITCFYVYVICRATSFQSMLFYYSGNLNLQVAPLELQLTLFKFDLLVAICCVK